MIYGRFWNGVKLEGLGGQIHEVDVGGFWGYFCNTLLAALEVLDCF